MEQHTTSNAAIRSAIVAALGGFLFGFDTAVISGVETDIQKLWSLDKFWHGFTVASALFGTVMGAAFAGRPSETYGRRKVLQGIGLLYLLTSLGAALTSTWWVFVAFRFLGGIGVGASSVVGPMYISEISPAHSRGRLVALFQFNVVAGILIAFLSNYFLYGIVEESWRWMLGVQAIPSFLYFVLVFLVPESPRWLIKQGKSSEAEGVLQQVGDPSPKASVDQIQKALKEEEASGHEKLFSKAYRSPIFYAVTLALFNQLSGINAIMYYAPRIFELTGLTKETSLLQAVSIGATNMIFTLLAITVIDKFGRKTLMLIGSVGVIVFLALTAAAFYQKQQGGYAVMIYLIGFIAFFAFSQGAVIWVFIAEIFPNRVRSKGQSLGSFTHWIMAALISLTFPIFAEGSQLGGAIAFTFFAVMMLLQLLFVWKVMPETKGKSLEQIQSGVLH